MLTQDMPLAASCPRFDVPIDVTEDLRLHFKWTGASSIGRMLVVIGNTALQQANLVSRVSENENE
jgi:hypothetical protein